MKGLELPISTVVIVAIAVLVLVVVSAFFLSQSGSQFSEIELRNKFNQLCTTLKCTVDEAINMPDNSEFYTTCKTLYGDITKAQCMQACGCKLVNGRLAEESVYNDLTRLTEELESGDVV